MTKRSLLYILFFCLSIATRGQIKSDIELSEVLPTPVQTQSFQYWFDSETDNIHEVSGLSGTYTLDVSSLTDGVHTLYYQAIGNDGKNYGLASAVFIKTMKGISELSGNMTIPATQLQYWFDSNTGNINIADASSGVFILDVSSLSDGIHTLSYRLVGVDDGVYSQASAVFLKEMKSLEELSNKAAIAATKLHYWFDSDTENIQVVSGLSGAYTLDVSSLAEGVHTIHYQVIGIDGTGYDEASKVFVKMPNVLVESTPPAVNGMKYWFDQNMASAVNISAVNGTQMIDVSALPDGVHTLYYQLTYADGNQSPAIAGIFFKDVKSTTPEEGNAITKYQYWLNGNSTWIKTVDITNVSNPYTLYALLPLTKAPVRSSSFHFEVRNNEPTIYAKNDLFVRFHDARGYFVDDKKPFIDYNVKQMVEPVGEIQQIETFDRIEENTIRWYTVCVEAGDTVAFKLSQPATIQLFSPSGEEVYAANGVDATTWNGVHTWDSATYYLAVHDVTGNRSTMTLEYMHMDKYDVVDCNVHSVGNGGCSTITFKGNGFRDLYAVDLYTAEGDTIHSVDVSHGSDAETAVTFDFTNVKLESYDAVFHFTEEDRYFLEAITVEEPIDIELTTDVTYPSRFLRGNPTTYTIKITNKGNMTAYCVPVEMKLRTSLQDKISRIIIDGDIEHLQIPDNIVGDSLDEDIKVFIQELLIEKGDLPQFVFYDGSSDGMSYGVSQFIVTIPPSSTKQINVNIYGSWDVEFQCHLSKDWYPISISGSTNRKIKAAIKQETRDWMCCQKERFECAADAITSVVSQITPPGWSCGVSVGNTVLQVVYDVWCSDGASLGEKIGNYIHSEGLSLANKIMSSVISCITANFRARKHALKEEANKALDKGDTQEFRRLANEFDKVVLEENSIVLKVYDGLSSLPIFNCIKLWTWGKPTCPPNPTSGGGRSIAVASFDPNDIYGYLSDAGSKFIADSVAKVNYTIEFENDTAFAQASAHTVVIKDTLDSRYFDLNSFLPTAVKIGKREAFIDESEVMSGNRTKGFLKTIDMRPEIYAIAQVEGTYDMASGIAEWRFSSLDPMTMEPTDDIMQGILPVNYDGTSGIGEVMFEIGVKANKGDGAQIANRAGIVFDYEEAILTPTWVNTVDAVAPTSTIAGGIQANDSTLTLRLTGSDHRSGVWRYNVYAQFGAGTSWELVAENVTDTLCDVRIYEDIDYSFCVLATDSAGNVERKEFQPEFSLSSDLLGDANGDGSIDLTDAIMITYHSLGAAQPGLNLNAADVNRDGVVDLTDAITVVYRSLGTENGGAGQGSGAEPE